ncbi:MAG: AI-2E family transporter [Bacillota bacterium]
MNNISIPKITRNHLLYLVIVLVAAYLAYKYGAVISDILRPFIAAAVISYLLNPVVDLLEDKGIKRIVGVLIVYMAFIAIILTLGFFLLPKLIKDIGKLVENMPVYSSDLQRVLNDFQDGYFYNNLPESIKEIIDENILALQGIVLSSLQRAADSIIAVLSQIFNIILVPVIIFYMLKDTSYFKNQIVLLVPKSKRNKAILLFRDIDNAFGKYIRGQIIIASFVSVMTTAALLILNVKYAVILGVFAGIANIIPYFGPVIGLVPTVVFAFFDSPTKALYAAGAFLLIQQIESGILTPKIIGESVGVHPVYVILSLIVGGQLFGVAGLIIAVPVLVAIKLTLRHLLRKA